MKKIYCAFALLLSLSGCAYLRTPAGLVSTSLDYSDYEKRGFFMTEANSVSFTYQSVGSVSAINTAGYKLSDQLTKRNSDDIYGTPSNSIKTTNEYIPAKKSVALEELYKKCLEIGANGVINLQIKYISIPAPKGTGTWGYEATGMAIKK